MGCKATGVSDDASPSAPITTTEALTYTGETAKGFFRSVSLVTDSRMLMTHTPGVLKGAGVYTTGGEVVTSEKTAKTGSAVIATKTEISSTTKTSNVASSGTGASTTKVPSVEVIISTATVAPTELESEVPESVVTDSVDSTASTTPSAASSLASASGTSSSVSASITASSARVVSASCGSMVMAAIVVCLAVGESVF